MLNGWLTNKKNEAKGGKVLSLDSLRIDPRPGDLGSLLGGVELRNFRFADYTS